MQLYLDTLMRLLTWISGYNDQQQEGSSSLSVLNSRKNTNNDNMNNNMNNRRDNNNNQVNERRNKNITNDSNSKTSERK